MQDEEEEEDQDISEDETNLLDIEDVGVTLHKAKSAKVQGPPKAMVTPKLRASLEKQRYKVVGSHSGVKVFYNYILFFYIN